MYIVNLHMFALYTYIHCIFQDIEVSRYMYIVNLHMLTEKYACYRNTLENGNHAHMKKKLYIYTCLLKVCVL